MSDLKTQLQEILNEKKDKILPENIKKDIQVFDIVGTYEGLDTNDADAGKQDILKGKTAYVKGEKVIGELDTLPDNSAMTVSSVGVTSDGTGLQVEGNFEQGGIVTNTTAVKMVAEGTQVIDAIGLAPDMIRAGANILGVEGTYDSNPEEYNAKFVVDPNLTKAPTPLQMLVSVESLDTKNLTVIDGMFNGCSSLKSIPELNLDKASQGSYVFRDCTNLVYLPNLHLPQIQHTSGMFQNCHNLAHINITTLGLNRAHSFKNMFANCYSLKALPDLIYNNSGSYSDMCYSCTNLEHVNWGGYLVANRISTQYCNNMFYNCTNLKTFSGILFDAYHFMGNTYCENMFKNCTNLTEIKNLKFLNGSMHFQNAFENCVNLTTLKNCSFPISGNCSNMFKNCISLTNAYEDGNISMYPNRETSNVFENCYNLRFNNGWVNASLSGGEYGGIRSVFVNCPGITSANIRTYMGKNYGVYGCFYNCEGLTTVNLETVSSGVSNLFVYCNNLRNVYFNCTNNGIFTLSSMFNSCSSLDDINNTFTGCNWEELVTGNKAFYNCTGLTTFGVPFVRGNSLNAMFQNCTSLVSMSETTIINATDMGNMFRDCTNLQASCNFVFNTHTSARPVFTNVFVNCTNLRELPAITFTSDINFSNSYHQMAPFGLYNLISNGAIQPLHNLVNVGGFINYGVGFYSYARSANNAKGTLDLVGAPNISEQSIQNIITNLYNLCLEFGLDTNGNCKFPQIIRMCEQQYAKLTEADITALQSKGWGIAVHTIPNA